MSLRDIGLFAALALLIRLAMALKRPGSRDANGALPVGGPVGAHIWALLVLGVLGAYWLQPLSPIRYLDYWLPTLTLALTTICWAVAARPQKPIEKQDVIAAGIVAGGALVVALTRYLSVEGLLTAARPPQTLAVVSVIGLSALAFLALMRANDGAGTARRAAIGIVALLVLFVVLKLPELARLAGAGLRALAGQSAAHAAATDLRWLGFSYVAFRLIHTLRDAQTGRLPRVGLAEYAVYVLFPPAFTAGPIDRLERFVKDLRRPLESHASDLDAALERVGLGLFKKFVLADALALAALSPAGAAQARSTGWLWVMLYAYSLQIYLDFSGYTDIAIGLGRLVGVRLPENFQRPYLQSSLTQFWNNWHMTLTQWIRAYAFNPLTRAMRTARKPAPPALALFLAQTATMVLIGLWHGITWNFLIWGLWHALGLFVQNRWSQLVRPWTTWLANRPRLQRVAGAGNTLLTFHYVALGWVWFALPDLGLSWQVLLRLAGMG